MGSKMMVGILLLLLSLFSIPSSAQQVTAPCWTKIWSCLETAKSQNYPRPLVLLCCPSIQTAVNNDRSCFCLGKSDIVSQDATTFFDDVLQTCSVPGTLDTICPDASSSTPTTPSTTPTTPSTTPATPSTTPTTPSTTPATPSTTPSTPSTTPTTPSTTPTTPSTTPATPSTTPATPSTPSTSTTNKVTVMSIPSLFMLLMSFVIC
ncbi:hypothetical protein RND81_05G147800 [Saponaria officinalis]|uniref:Uncharacterized protein n=1 Tax=Saponaria officinalis TaxID=3572 RepID=A0AAW1KY69_SAPOF